MNAPRLLLSLSVALLTGLSLAACDAGPILAGDGQYAGRACETAGEVVDCNNDGKVAYCGYESLENAQGWYGELTYGACMAPEEAECEPGEYRHEPGPDNGDDEWEDPCAGSDYACEVIGGEPMWVYQECYTPLVLSFDSAPLEMIAAEATPAATFDIAMRPNSCLATDWPSAATPWLVVDLDGNGMIDGGNELFGSGTKLSSGRHAEHGFAALAEFDHDHDGDVDGSDPRFAELMLWRDHDADRVSTPDELETLASAGIESLPVDFRVKAECDERGNCGVQRAGFAHAGGFGEVVDIHLACQ